jgi:hypothetical protein
LSTKTPKTPQPLKLEDFAGLFQALAALGVEAVVIGGCAVGAYARLLGETVISNDLDLLVTRAAVQMVLDEAGSIGARVVKRPQPRSVFVAVLEWEKKEVNLLIGSTGLEPAEKEARLARQFVLQTHGITILLADPVDLLRNKLSVDRPKDRPHVDVLRRFLIEEAVHAFEEADDPRDRLAPAERLLGALGVRALPAELADRLVPLAKTPADFRFLAHRVPTRDHLAQVVDRTVSTSVAEMVRRIAESRRFRR